MRTSLGHKIVCDGKYFDAKGNLVPCTEELHPETRAVISKAGVMGHHCSLCFDPAATAVLADKLGVPEWKLRKMSDEQVEAAKEKLAKAEASAAADLDTNAKIDAALANLQANKDGLWLVPECEKPFETKKEAVAYLENQRPAPPRKNGNGKSNGDGGSTWPQS